MSKRIHRHLAVVAGASLAIGAMAPAMANHASAEGEATVSADVIDVNELTGLLPGLNLVNTQLVSQLTASLLATPFAVLGAAQTAADAALGCVGDISGLAGGVGAVTNLGLGGGSVGATVVIPDLVTTVGDVTGCVTEDVVPAALGVVGPATAPVMLATGAALQTVAALPTTVGQVTGTALGLPGFILGGGLGGASASGGVNVLAGVMGIF